ncbi:MAG: hypothetical protein QXM27_02765 [Candidatus Pacearchaeota archaeon]
MIEEEVLRKFQDFYDYINTIEFPIVASKNKSIYLIINKITNSKVLTDKKYFCFFENYEEKIQILKSLSWRNDRHLYNILISEKELQKIEEPISRDPEKQLEPIITLDNFLTY